MDLIITGHEKWKQSTVLDLIKYRVMAFPQVLGSNKDITQGPYKSSVRVLERKRKEICYRVSSLFVHVYLNTNE